MPQMLYLVEPVGELLVHSLVNYEGKKLKSIEKETIKLGSSEEQERPPHEIKQKEEEASGLLELLQKAVDEHVKQVRLSNRLVPSPA